MAFFFLLLTLIFFAFLRQTLYAARFRLSPGWAGGLAGGLVGGSQPVGGGATNSSAPMSRRATSPFPPQAGVPSRALGSPSTSNSFGARGAAGLPTSIIGEPARRW